MRDVYYQAVGNPVQYDRLPTTRPAIELHSPTLPGSVRVTRIATLITAACIAVLVLLVTWRPPGWSWLEPFDLAFALPVLAGALAHAAITREPSPLWHPLTLAAVAVLALNHRVPGGGHVLLAGAVTGMLTYGLGIHGAYVFTGSPVSRQIAEPMRAGWRRQLLVLAGIAALLTVAVLSTGAVLFKLAVIALPLAALFTRAPAGLRRSRLSVLRECCDSWLTYQPPPVPGLLQSPLGSAHHRAGMLMLATIITTILLISIPDSPLSLLYELGQRHHLSVLDAYDLQEASLFESMRYGTFVWILTFLTTLILPVALPWLLAMSLASPVLMEAAACNDQASGDNLTQLVLADMRRSPDRTERGSVYLGRVVADGSPVQIPREVFSEHAHGLGDSGGGKTSLFLCPLIEQLGMTGECSVIVIDNKADTLELLASLQAVAESVRRERREELPLKVFSNQGDKASFAFNPMTQPFWSNFDLFTRTDIICGANGLTYGSDYGQGYYSSANAAILYHTLKTFPHVSTFSELAECIAEVTVSASKRELHPARVDSKAHRIGQCGSISSVVRGERPSWMDRM